jgi:transcriptional regulator with GAF, ATPase, and Fis domain
MDLTQVERQRSQLLQFVLFLIILFLVTVVFLAIQEETGPLIPALGILSLLACLYVISKERGLKQLHAQLIEEVIQKERQVKQLGQELQTEQHHLQDEQTKKLEVERRLRELSSLYKAISSVNAITDAQRTPESVLRSSLELVNADCGSVMLLDATGQYLVIIASQGISADIVAQTRQPIAEGIAGWVVTHREPLLLTEDLKDDPHLKSLIRRPKDFSPAMSVPLQVRGTVIGVINFRISEKGEKRKFTEYDLRMASLFAQHASVAIDNSRLMTALRHAQAAQRPGGEPRRDVSVG